MVDVVTAILALTSFGFATLGFAAGKLLSREDSDERIAEIREECRTLEAQIIELLANEKTLASKKQLLELQQRAKGYSDAAESQKQLRAELEKKLTTSHSDVIAREKSLQEMKTQQQSDEEKLQAVLDSYKDVTSESVALERTLAESLKTIDKMSSEVAISDGQKSVFDSLATALTLASTQLRDVIVEHQNIYERLAALQSQYVDLETEYVKLVDMQLES